MRRRILYLRGPFFCWRVFPGCGGILPAVAISNPSPNPGAVVNLT